MYGYYLAGSVGYFGLVGITNRMPLKSSLVREENELYNRLWIEKFQMVGQQMVSAKELDIDENMRVDASPFMVVWLRNIEILFNLLPKDIDLTEYSLIDIGCGSGISTAFIYANYNLKSTRGFDFSKSLIEAALINKAMIEKSVRASSTISFEINDATSFSVPNEKVILFLFNPFGWATMSVFIQNNIETLRRNGSYMLYANDRCISELAEWGAVVARDDVFNLSVVRF